MLPKPIVLLLQIAESGTDTPKSSVHLESLLQKESSFQNLNVTRKLRSHIEEEIYGAEVGKEAVFLFEDLPVCFGIIRFSFPWFYQIP